ncbi:glycosyltransferase family 2 protein [Romeriopsis navalis]|uniref:glycosyltransferase family 2 protein n=1 Tax=Romeriopsis navalis TaxID=2992132 RepID=UPI0021F8F316|nr:glycosyltransferase family 2 protein [Romeriopsis navalis]
MLTTTPLPVRAPVLVLLPVHNEETNLDRMVHDIDAAFAAVSHQSVSAPPFILFVDDGSRDCSRAVIEQIIQQRGQAACLCFSRNFGHQAAVMAGLAYAPADYVVLIMDADGQDPPYVGFELVERIWHGVDVAYGVRRNRQGNPLKRLAYWAFYRTLSQLSNLTIPLDAGDFCAYSPRAVQMMTSLKEQRPYVRGLRAWIGLRQVGVPYDRPDRYAGATSYSWKRLMQLAADGIISFSLKPLRLAMILGLLTFLVSCLLGGMYLMLYLFDWNIAGQRMREVPGFTTLILVMLGFSGLQMMMLGIIGEYLGRVFEEAKGRPLFIVADTLGRLEPTSVIDRHPDRHRS